MEINREILSRLRKRGFQPRFHGNGFIQLYLNDAKTKRLHVWHPDHAPQRDHNAQIHDHRFEMTSNVLVGKLRHITYDAHAVDSLSLIHI